MALRFIDSCGDHYTAAQATQKWTSASALTRVAGVHGYALDLGYLRKGMLFPSLVVIMECQVKFSGGAVHFFSIADTDPALHPQVGLTIGNDGAITAERWSGSSPLIAQTAPDIIRMDTWYHLGWRVYLHSTAGTVEVRVNGGEVLNVTGVRTVSPPTGWTGAIGSFSIGGAFALGASGTAIIDDLVVMDDVDDGINDPRLLGGGGFDKLLGPVEIVVKRPNGVGTLAEWTPAPVVPNWQNVADVDPDADTTVNSTISGDIGQADLFAMEDLLPAEDVLAVQSLVLARKTEAGVAALAPLVRDAGTGTTTVGATVYQPNTYSYMIRPEPTLPDGSQWSAARWDAIEYGYQRIV